MVMGRLGRGARGNILPKLLLRGGEGKSRELPGVKESVTGSSKRDMKVTWGSWERCRAARGSGS